MLGCSYYASERKAVDTQHEGPKGEITPGPRASPFPPEHGRKDFVAVNTKKKKKMCQDINEIDTSVYNR